MVSWRGCYRGTPCFLETLDKVKLPPLEKSILEKRYIPMILCLEKRCFRIAILFHIGRIIVTVGSLIVPALLSIQYTSTGEEPSSFMNPNAMAYQIYWTTWVLSLLVTTSNGILGLFKMDKKYYFLHTTLEQLRSEGWQYLQLSGRYSGFYIPGTKPSHENQFIYFCNAVEKIKMKQVQEEYYKLIDGNAHLPGGKPAEPADSKEKLSLDSLIPPTPLKPLLEQASKLHPELLKQLLPFLSTSGANIVKEINGQPASASAASAASASAASASASAASSPRDTIVSIDQIKPMKKMPSAGAMEVPDNNSISSVEGEHYGEAEVSVSSLVPEGSGKGGNILLKSQKELPESVSDDGVGTLLRA
jgi:hypothetical protein